MGDKMLVTQALDERNLLVKQIGDKIDELKVVDTKRKNQEKTSEYHLSIEELSAKAKEDYQRVLDMISRYQRLENALGASNASTVIHTSLGDYTLTGAIALRNRLRGLSTLEDEGKFEDRLREKLVKTYHNWLEFQEEKNNSIDAQAQTMRLSILGREIRGKDEKPLEVVDAFIRENLTELVDPLDCMKKAEEIKEKMDELARELDTQIKIANATTFIEF